MGVYIPTIILNISSKYTLSTNTQDYREKFVLIMRRIISEDVVRTNFLSKFKFTTLYVLLNKTNFGINGSEIIQSTKNKVNILLTIHFLSI